MIIRPNEHIIISIVLFLINVAVSVLFFLVDSNIFIALTIFALLLVINIRYYVSLCKTLVFDKDGITVMLPFYKKRYNWDDLKTKRLVEYTGSYGYKDNSLCGAEFSSIEINKTYKLKSTSYCVFFKPLNFIFVCFTQKSKQKYTANYPMPYTVDEELFMKMVNDYCVKLDKYDSN